MANFWFVSAPLFSHTDWGGFLPTARALQAQGHSITWVSSPPLQRVVESAGLSFEAIEETG
ncbi:MAG: hypothetical protein AAF125_02645, partial [Chloroflexota bacterium]